MADVVQATGTGADFEWRGKTWTVRPMGPGIRAELTKYARAKALANAADVGESMSNGDRRQLLADVRRDVVGGHYDYGADGADQIFGGTDGNIQRVLILLKASHPEVTLDDVRAMFGEVGPAICGAIVEANRPRSAPAK